MIEKLLGAIAAGGCPDTGADAVGVEEIADILWLAARVDAAPRPAESPAAPRTGPDGDSHRGSSGNGATGTTGGPGAQLFPAGRDARQDPARRDGAGEVEGGPGGRRGVPLRVPRAAVLHDPLAVMRALKPLGRRSIGGPGKELDERLTVERSIEQRSVTPVLRGAESRWLDLAVVVDTNHSMLLWADLVDELRGVLTSSGVFRDVRTWFLSGTGSGGRPSVAHRRGATPRHPREIADPSGRRLTLVLTDLVGGGWREGGVQDVLRQWSEHNSVAVLNVLPERLWSRGAVRAVPFVVRAERPAAGTASWPHFATARRSRPARRRDGATAPEAGIAVPVTDVSPAGMSRLAGLVAGDGRWRRMPCLRLDPQPDGTRHPAPAPGGLAALERFRASASPTAQRLAAHLAAVPLTLPVMTLVRRSMLTDSEHGHLAEVALGGLFAPWGTETAAATVEPDDLEFDFLPGVREALLGSQLRGDVATVRELVRHSVWEYIERNRAETGREFTATRVVPGQGGPRRVGERASPFAEERTPGPPSPGVKVTLGTAREVSTAGPLQPVTGEPAADSPFPADRVVVFEQRLRSSTRGEGGMGILLTPRLVLATGYDLRYGVRAHHTAGNGKEVACTEIWRGRSEYSGVALLLARVDLVDPAAWAADQDVSPLRWGAVPAGRPFPVRVDGFSDLGNLVRLSGDAQVRTGRMTVKVTAEWRMVRGGLVSHEGVLLGLVASMRRSGSRFTVLPVHRLLEDPVFKRVLGLYLETVPAPEGIGGRAEEPLPDRFPSLCVALNVKWRGIGAHPLTRSAVQAAERDIRTLVTGIMEGIDVDGRVLHDGPPDLLVLINQPRALVALGRLLRELPEALRTYNNRNPQAAVMLDAAVSAGDVRTAGPGEHGHTVTQAGRLAEKLGSLGSLRDWTRPDHRPLVLGLTETVRALIDALLGPFWEPAGRQVPFSGREGPEYAWVCLGDVSDLGYEIERRSREAEHALDGSVVSWTRCGIGASPHEPEGCPGARVRGYALCLAHLSPLERAAYLAALQPGDHVDFRGTAFTEGLLAEFLAAARDPVSERTHLGAAMLDEAVFSGRCDLSGAYFEGPVSFARATFLGTLVCDGTRFSEFAVFDAAVFRDGGSFIGASFGEETSFPSAVFGARADFRGARFERRADFDRAVFQAAVVFDDARFGRSASFAHVSFEGPARLSPTRFDSDTTFEHAHFRGIVEWHGTRFMGRLSCAHVTFSGRVDFRKVSVLGRCGFSHSTFVGPVIFGHVVLAVAADFSHVAFLDDVIFVRSAFHGYLNFLSSDFRGQLVLDHVTFAAPTSFEDARISGAAPLPELPGGWVTRPADGESLRVVRDASPLPPPSGPDAPLPPVGG